jgi:hypothetical protein
MVKTGTRVIEGVNVAVTSIDQLKTPSPALSDKDSVDIGVKIRYAIDQIEAIKTNLDVALSTRATEATLSAIKTNIDVTLTALAKLKRWGRNIEPSWVHAAEVTAPAAGAVLVSKAVGAGKSGYIYGFFISAGELNDFKINWTSGGTAYSIRIPFGGKGAIQYVDFAALNEGLPADAGSSITITNVNAGSSGIIYQARILYAEI